MSKTATETMLALQAAPSTQASTVKREGWRGILDQLRKAGGTLVVRNHSRIEGIVLDLDRYQALLAAAQLAEQQMRLAELAVRFDERLEYLRSPEGTAQLRAMTRDVSDLEEGVPLGPSL